MSLTIAKINKASPNGKTFKLYEGRGLYLEVSPKGGKYWRFKYRFEGKEKLLSLGIFPATSLDLARTKRDDLKKLLAEGINPSAERKALKVSQNNGNSFESVAREWHKKHSSKWSKSHASGILKRLENDIFPALGNARIAEIIPSTLLPVLQRIEKRGAIETAHRTLRNCGEIFRYAVAIGKAERDPTGDLKGALSPPSKSNFSAITEPQEVGRLLKKLNQYQGALVVKSALKLAPLLFVRPGELRIALWKGMDLEENREWRFRDSKTDTERVIPLSTQAIIILKELKEETGHGLYVFPGTRDKGAPMSDKAVLYALRSLGIGPEEMSGHGFRAMARTILDEVLEVRPDIIEHQLGHVVKDPNGRAYNRTAHLPARKKMMQTWADYLDGLLLSNLSQSLSEPGTLT